MITKEVFLENFSIDLKTNPDFVRREVVAAIETANSEEIEVTILLIWVSDDISTYVDLLNELLINPNHRRHQLIAKTLQDHAPHPSTVPFVRKALESDFDYLQYTCSEPRVIAKWFSWLLYSIGNKEAIWLMKEFSSSNNRAIAKEMSYRLRNIQEY